MNTSEALKEIVELLNPGTRFMAGDKATCDRITEVLRKHFSEEHILAIRATVSDAEKRLSATEERT